MRKAKTKLAKLGAFAVATVMTAGIAAPTLGALAAVGDPLMQGSDGKYMSIPADAGVTSHADVLRYESDLNLQLAAEGFALLKNSNKTLPLKSDETKITLLGENAYSIQDGGGGSGSASRPGTRDEAYDWIDQSVATLDQCLDGWGFDINPKVAKLYNGANANGENHTYMELVESDSDVTLGSKKYKTTDSNYLKGVESSFEDYGDAAIINIMRSGSEFNDNSLHGVANHADENEHYLTLNDYERQLLAYAKYQKAQGKFSKIIVIINAASPMEIGDLQDDNAIGAILWTGTTGWDGAKVIGAILDGTVNPSGHVVDFWMRDFTTDPTWYNWGNYEGAAYILSGGETYDHSQIGASEATYGGGVSGPRLNYEDTSTIKPSAYLLSYSEGIFMGYRYYETVYADLKEAKGADAANEWWNKTALYPFGHGLSYTTFEQKMEIVSGDLSDEDGELTIKVTVTNKGDVAGKDVVQLYSTPPYNDGGIDKAEVNLVTFDKTDVIEPNESEEVTLKVAVKDLATFDWNDKNKDDHAGYELEKGDYVLSVRKNSHDVYDSKTITAAKKLNEWDEDGSNKTPNNIFSQKDGKWEIYNTDVSHWLKSGTDHDLHRNMLVDKDGNLYDLKKLAWGIGEGNDNVFTEKAAAVVNYRASANVEDDYDDQTTVAVETDKPNLWVKTKDDMKYSDTEKAITGRDYRTQGAGKADEVTGLYDITIDQLIGKEYDNILWDKLIDQLTWDELKAFVSVGGYNNAAIPSIGKPRITDQDGPGQLKANGLNGWFWVGETVIAATWNQELAYQQGFFVGCEQMWNDGGGWYGPAMNNHRNPLAGRNFEYYSQDGVQGGLIAAAVVGGCVDAGGRVYIKHSFINDQEANRMNGLATFCNEQAIREIYAKPFELSIRLGKANGIMSSFANIALQGSASYAINVQLYTNEWGYRGATVTDFYSAPGTNSGWTAAAMLRGLQFPLGTNTNNVEGTWDADANVVKVVTGQKDGKDVVVDSYTQWYWARETAKRILYVYVNSTAIKNGLLDEKVFAPEIADVVYGANGEYVHGQPIHETYVDYNSQYGTAGDLDISINTTVSGNEINLVQDLTEYGMYNGEYKALIDTEYLAQFFGGYDKFTYRVTGLPKGLEFLIGSDADPDMIQYYEDQISEWFNKIEEGYDGESFYWDWDQEEVEWEDYCYEKIAELYGWKNAYENEHPDYAGIIVGTPEEWGTFTLTVYVEGLGEDAWQYAVANVKLIIAPNTNDLAEENAALRAQIANLQTALTNLQNTVNGLQTSNTNLSSALEALQNSVNELAAVVDSLEGDNADLKAELASIQTKLSALQADSSVLDKLNEIQKQLDAMQEDKGCGSIIGAGAAVVAGLTILGGSVLVMKRKKD